MIRKLRRKFVLIMMAVVFLILLAIFFTLLISTQRNNEQMSGMMLRQALSMRPFPLDAMPQSAGRLFPQERGAPNMRLPILVLEIGEDGTVAVVSNQLHFIGEDDISPIAARALDGKESMGILSDYALRYLRGETEYGTRLAFADISFEREQMRTQIINSLTVGALALIAFFLMSMLLARWAVRPVERAWDRQKQFTANASHELKTPLTVILSNADMLRTHAFEDEKNARRMEHIHAEALRMKRLVEDLLTLARFDSAEKTENYAAVDFSYIVKSSVLTHEPIIYDEVKRLLYNIEEGICVMGDAARLQQVTHILLDNARKYSPEGSIIYASLERSEPKRLLFTVSNIGSPIPKEELENIFMRFYRLDEARSGYESFGLGLSIAQSIINEHKGKIWAESDGEKRNSFFVSLPVV